MICFLIADFFKCYSPVLHFILQYLFRYYSHKFYVILLIFIHIYLYYMYKYVNMECPNKGTRFKVRTLLCPTTLLSRGGNL